MLGLKLRNLRHARGYTLTDLADRSGLSVSYLSEIEKGKKYPKPDKLIDLARALEIPFDDLVSLQVARELDPLKAALSSPFIQEFPFRLFGLAPGDLLDLVTEDPGKVGALIRTFLDIGRMYDVQVEHFLFAALRSYQEMKANYFEELELKAIEYRAAKGWPEGEPIEIEPLRRILVQDYGYRIDGGALADHPELHGFRWVFVDGEAPQLFVNGDLLASQRAFIMAYEIGYRYLGLPARTFTASTWLKTESFEQVLNNFKASYFAGALLMDRRRMGRDLEEYFQQTRWDGRALVELMRRYRATPEMFFYRLSQLLPHLFGLGKIFLMRFSNEVGTDQFRLTKVLNISGVPVPHGIGLNEHHCRRWPAMRLLQELGSRQGGCAADAPIVSAQRSHFLDEDVEFFVMSAARPLVLTAGTDSAVSLGLLLDEDFKQRVAFWNDPAIPRVSVNLTCERCGLSEQECEERAAPPSVHRVQQARQRKEMALQSFISSAAE